MPHAMSAGGGGASFAGNLQSRGARSFPLVVCERECRPGRLRERKKPSDNALRGPVCVCDAYLLQRLCSKCGGVLSEDPGATCLYAWGPEFRRATWPNLLTPTGRNNLYIFFANCMTSVPPETGAAERQKADQKMTPEFGIVFQAFF